MTDFNTDIVSIPSDNIDKLEKKVAQINKKAIKNGLVPMVLNIGDAVTLEEINKGIKSYTIKYPVSISGEFPAINGWKCIAKIDHKDGVNIVAIFDDINVTKWRERKPTCDHCGHNKIKVQSYLIQNEDSGEILQIGKSCIKDYIKGDPKWMLQMLTWINTLDEQLENEFSMGGTEQYFDVETIATVSALAIRKSGFVPSGSADYESGVFSTVSMVEDYFFGKRDKSWVSYWDITDADKEIGKGMIEYFNGQSGDNNFCITIKQLLELGMVRPKFFSYLAGAVSGYFKHLERETKKEIDAKILRVNDTVGTIKKREDFNVTLENVLTTHGYYGTTYIHKFRKDTGETIVWFANGTALDREVGETFPIKATVKKFDEYNEWKQTIVTRVIDIENK